MRLHLLIAAAFLLTSIHGQAQTPPAPPRNVADILAVLDQYKPDPEVVTKLRLDAMATPPAIDPDTNDLAARQELAVFYHRRGRANAAIDNYRQSIADGNMAIRYVWEGSPLPQPSGLGDKSRMIEDLAGAAQEGGNLLQALALRQQLIQITQNKWGRSLYAWVAIARINRVLGDMPAARKAVGQAEELFATLKSERSWPDYGHNWSIAIEQVRGDVQMWEGNYAEAERRYRRSIDEAEADYKANARRISRRQFTHSQAHAMILWANSDALLAEALRYQSRLAEAEFYARSALGRRLQARAGAALWAAPAIVGLGATVFEAGRFSDAAELAQAAINAYERAGVVPESAGIALARLLLGESHVARRDWPKALDVFAARDKSLAADPVQYGLRSGDESGWGIALLRAGQSKAALPMLERIYRKRLSFGLVNTEYFTAQFRGFYAMALAADGQTEKALAEFQGAIPVLLDDARRNGGEQGGAVARQMRMVWILESYMKLLVDLRDSPLLKAAGIDAAAEAFRIADVARGSAVQRALAESAARATPSDPALADLARREQDAQQRFGTLSDLLNRLLSAPPEQQLPKVIADLRRDIEALRVERDKLKVELAQRFPDYAELIAPKPATLAQVQTALAPDEALVSIYVGAERSYVWAVPKAGKAAFAEVALTDSELAQQVAHLRKALDVGEVALNEMPRFDLAQSHDLYRKLLLPVEAGWREAKNLVIVPHKALGQLPFVLLATAPVNVAAANPATAAKGALFEEYRSVPWLLRRAAVTQLPSVSTLLALRRMPAAKPGRKEFIGFGDPLFSNAMALAANDGTSTRRRFRNLGISTIAAAPMAVVPDAPVPVPAATVTNSAGLAQLARLPDTAEEITSIARVLKADVANDIFLGRAASEKNAKSGQLDNRRIVMFATHGLVPGDLNGLTQPALALSSPEVTGNPNEDGLLTMGEVLGLRLNADWVVLSACNTAAGEGAGSEAVSGLGKAFFFAGARTLLVSNWPVETVSAKLLTTKLFEHQTANPGATRAEALRSTMLDLMENSAPAELPGSKGYSYAHPMFWAPFSLVGDGGR